MAEKGTEQYIIKGSFNDFDEFSHFARGWDLDFRQLDQGRFGADLLQVRTSSVLLSHATFNRHIDQRGNPPAGLRTFAILRNPSVPLVWRGKIIPRNGIMAFPPGEELDAVSKSGFDVFTLSFSEELLAATSRSLGLPELEDLIHQADVVEGNPLLVKGVRRWLTNVCRDYEQLSGEKGTLMPNQLLECDLPRRFLGMLAVSQPFFETSSYRIRNRAMKRVEWYIADFLPESFTISDLCQVAQVSERTLQYAFLERFGIGPKRYLQTLRLNRVKRDLFSANSDDTKIADIANRWGFWHMGQFAADYRKLFGELPSETLKKEAQCVGRIAD